jgi:hypothetical protein
VAGEKFTPGMIGVTIVTKDPHLARSLWDRGWPVTAQSGRGESGPVTVLSVPVNRRDETRLHGDVQRIAPDAVCTTRDLRAPNSAYQSDPPNSRSRRTGCIRKMSAAARRMASSSEHPLDHLRGTRHLACEILHKAFPRERDGRGGRGQRR